jgi:hypothetical protein
MNARRLQPPADVCSPSCRLTVAAFILTSCNSEAKVVAENARWTALWTTL